MEPPPDWEGLAPGILEEINPLLNGVRLLAAVRRVEVSEEVFLQEVNRNLITFGEEGVGTAEYNQVDGVLFIRIVHRASKLSLLFVEKDKVQGDSGHLRQIVARQHIDAGDPDASGRKRGRDVVIVWLDQEQISSTEYRPRFLPGTGEWWADYWHATYKKPKHGDFMVGCFCGALQMATAACVSGIKVGIDPTTSFDTVPVMMSGLFGLTIGTWSTTYRNWTYRGSDLAKIGKLSTVSLAYAYSLTFVRDGFATVFRFREGATWLLHAHYFANTAMNNWGRSAWQRVPEIRSWMRTNTGTLSFKVFGKTIARGISRASFENQMIYLIPFTLKLVGLVGVGVGVQIPLTSWKIDSGTLLLLGSIPLAQYLVLKVAERSQYPRVEEVRKQWEEIKRLPFTFPKKIAVTLVKSARELREEIIPLGVQTTKSALGACAGALGSIGRRRS